MERLITVKVEINDIYLKKQVTYKGYSDNKCVKKSCIPQKVYYVVRHLKYTFQRFLCEWIETLSVSYRQVLSYVRMYDTYTLYLKKCHLKGRND